MKPSTSSANTSTVVLLKVLTVALMLAACTETEVLPSRPKESESANPIGVKQTLNPKVCAPQGPNYNLNVLLMGNKRGAIGFIKFRQYETETQMIHLDTWIHGLERNTSYLLQRAVDTTLDGNCTGTAWLTLGKGTVAQAIVTNNFGGGYEELFRSVAAIPVGSTFDIHFQIIKETTGEVVLASDCYQYTVR